MGQGKERPAWYIRLWDSVSGLWLDERTGKIVGSKLAATTGHAIIAFWFCWHNYHTGYNETMWLIYAGLITGHKTLEKLIGMKYGSKDTSNFNVDIPDQSDLDIPDDRPVGRGYRQAYMGRGRG